MNDDRQAYIAVLTDRDFGLEPKEYHSPYIRHGARGIVLNDRGQVAILNKATKNEYKLIGGGIEYDESPELAFRREVLEETGYEIEVDASIGAIKEEKSQDNFIQISYLFVAHITKNTGHIHLTKKEQEEGSRLLWMSLDDAIAITKSCESNLKASSYESLYYTRFIVRRDHIILKYYQSLIAQPQTHQND